MNAHLIGLLLASNLAAQDFLPPSELPPGGLMPEQVPLFVSFGFDDNGYAGYPEQGLGSGGMKWAIDLFNDRSNPAGTGNPATFDGAPTRVTFFHTCVYGSHWTIEDPFYVRKAWREAYDAGHEVGNHTQTHAPGGGGRSLADWLAEIEQCNQFLTAPKDPNDQPGSANPLAGLGIPAAEIKGFRSPFLEYNDATFQALEQLNFAYDTSIEEGWQWHQDGGSFNWPYTLDLGSPGNELKVSWGNSQPISNYPGLWQLPVHPFIVPADSDLGQYGLTESVRAKAAQQVSWFDSSAGKITGFDYNLFVSFDFTEQELLAILKHSLDLRLAGNRAPMLLGAHTDFFHDRKSPDAAMRRQVLTDFLDYALSKPEVRIVRFDQVIDWLRDPVPLDPNGPMFYRVETSLVPTAYESDQCTQAEWSASQAYPTGQEVAYDGQAWKSRWWNQGEQPSQGEWGAWQWLSPCTSTEYQTHGQILPSGPLNLAENQSQLFEFVADPGYTLIYVKVNGVPQQLVNQQLLLEVQANTQIEAYFSAQ